MRHRAARPLIDLWLRLPRATAHRLGLSAARGRARVLAPLVAALAVGVGGFAVVASVTGGSTTSPEESPAAAAPSGSERPGSTTPSSGTGDPGPTGSAAEPAPPTTGSPAPTSSTSGPAEAETGTRDGLLPLDTGSAVPSPRPVAPRASASSTEDVTAPVTRLAPELPDDDLALLTFSADEEASFTCSLDGAAFSSCASPVEYPDLEPGWHTFAVRATDAAGNVDTGPARTRWLSTRAESGAPEGP